MLLLMAADAGAVSLWLHQPVLIAYIVIGIAVLLFVVGLKLDVQHIRHIGPVALATGLGQLAY